MSAIDQMWIAGQEFQRPATDSVDLHTGSSLLSALLSGDLDTVQALIIAGVPVGLLEASMLGDRMQIQRLLDAGVQVDQTSSQGWAALHLAAWSGHTQIVALFLDAGVPVDLPALTHRAFTGCTALHLAVVRGHGAVVQQLLDAGADPLRKDEAGWTPLHQAAERGHLGILKRLLLAGAHVNALCGDTTPLGLAQRSGHPHVVALLRQIGGTD